ncbi:DUF3263 domain-containing protein [Micrococcus sp. HG099]|jgi:hypothetical protein|uniref:DUF3263 domain-containing protein n=1 Tax=Micrococcus endophyticus TaxID=455343 RepID=A0A7W9JJ84_9MICC|nr:MULTISPECIES: DUF3263 domain-containing protein [Micrococcus]MBB5848950.1 hypothetical protein [Micrococcus endophyticus]MCK6091686.1 DUF3263 domain-containing protein [Micrococcus endophyticus]MCR8676366.1 DUF3263 domain-containing protein [Micrococcus sp. HG099]QCP08755.1 DUF3263 domain-containing protein [Micrococcus luteus]
MPTSAPEPRRDALTPQERAVLDLEAATWRHGGAKDHAVRERLGLSPTAYYQVLNGLLDREAALAYRPLLVARLLRKRGTRSRARRAPADPAPSTPASRQEN